MGRVAILLAALAVSSAALAQSVTKLVGSAYATGESPQHFIDIHFSCEGEPTCIGRYQGRFVNPAGPNEPACDEVVVAGFRITGLTLAQPGGLQGSVTFEAFDWPVTPQFQCQAQPGTAFAVTFPYTGTWNGNTATLAFDYQDGNSLFHFTGDFTADRAAPPPVFPMVVTASIGAQTSSASAQIQFRPQDLGRTGGVFVFASAPATRVLGGLESKAMHLGHARMAPKADPVPCVLAQKSPSGQLVAVTASQLQAIVTGSFTAAGASASILDNTPTANVAGATFYVGYGENGTAMLDAGIFRNAVLVPGNSICPMLPYVTALWWNAAESGWGLNLNHQGNVAFATLFTYDAARAPMWLVMSAGALQADGLTFSGDLYRTTGPAFNANPFTPIGAANVTRVGTMDIHFPDANAGILTYTVNGVAVTKNIQRQVFGARAANCLPTSGARTTSTNVQDLWWNPAESGWGLNVTHQGDTVFATLFTYDASGRDLWLVMSSGLRQADGSYLGDLYRTTGSPFNAVPFTPIGAADVTTVGNMRLRFTNGEAGTLTYTYGGATVTKSIVRQVFSTPLSACN